MERRQSASTRAAVAIISGRIGPGTIVMSYTGSIVMSVLEALGVMALVHYI